MDSQGRVSYRFADYLLQVSERRLLKNGDLVPLTPKAFDTLVILVKNTGRVIEKADLFDQVWTDTFVGDGTLAQNILTLRKALGTGDNGEQFIETVPRHGYRFAGVVVAVQVSAGSVTPNAEIEASQNSSSNHLTASGHGKSLLPIPERAFPLKRSNRYVGTKAVTSHRLVRFGSTIAFAAIVIAVGLAAAVFFSSLTKSKADANSSGKIGSIAVLPFTPIGSESGDEMLGLGVADAVINRLGRLRSIPTRPTSSIVGYVDRPAKSSISAGRDLGVDAVLEGTVQRDDGRIRLSVRLVEVSSGNTLWAENLDEQLTDTFDVQDSISSKVADALELKLSPQQTVDISAGSSRNIEANRHFQLGVYFANYRTKEGLLRAKGYFQKAVDADPGFARSYASLADTSNLLGYYGFADRNEMAAEARQAAETALRLDDSVAEAHIAIAFLEMNKTDGADRARKEVEKAIDLAPFNSVARVRYGWLLLADGMLDRSVEQMRLAQQYDPLSAVSNRALCDALSFQNRYAEAVVYCERSVDISPDAVAGELGLADIYFLSGRFSEAISRVEKLLKRTAGEEKHDVLGALGYYYAKLGRSRESEKIVAELSSKATKHPQLLKRLAQISYALGKQDAGFNFFEQAHHKGLASRTEVSYYPTWSEVRDDPRVQALSTK